MTYTAEQLRDYASSAGNVWYAPILLAFADALEENARLKAAWDASHKQAMKNGAACNEWRDRAERAEAELAKLRQHAEAMADDLDMFAAQPDYDGPLYGPMPSLIAYRADFPEEK